MMPDEQNVSQKRDESSPERDDRSTEQDVPVDANLNDLVGRSRQATREAEEALRNAGQGSQPGNQPVQQKGPRTEQEDQGNTEKQVAKRNTDADAQNRNVNDATDREAGEADADNIGTPDAAQGSASDGDTAP